MGRKNPYLLFSIRSSNQPFAECSVLWLSSWESIAGFRCCELGIFFQVQSVHISSDLNTLNSLEINLRKDYIKNMDLQVILAEMKAGNVSHLMRVVPSIRADV